MKTIISSIINAIGFLIGHYVLSRYGVPMWETALVLIGAHFIFRIGNFIDQPYEQDYKAEENEK